MALHGGTGAGGVSNLSSGVYTPTLGMVANLSYVNPNDCFWQRIGNIVMVSGKIDVDPVTIDTATTVSITLPVASNIGAITDIAGVTACPGAVQCGSVEGDAATDTAYLRFIAKDVSTRGMAFTFTYRVI